MRINWTGSYRGYELVQREMGGLIEIWYGDEHIETVSDGHYRGIIDAYLDAA